MNVSFIKLLIKAEKLRFNWLKVTLSSYRRWLVVRKEESAPPGERVSNSNITSSYVATWPFTGGCWCFCKEQRPSRTKQRGGDYCKDEFNCICLVLFYPWADLMHTSVFAPALRSSGWPHLSRCKRSLFAWKMLCDVLKGKLLQHQFFFHLTFNRWDVFWRMIQNESRLDYIYSTNSNILIRIKPFQPWSAVYS